jgi:hypothetical protein
MSDGSGITTGTLLFPFSFKGFFEFVGQARQARFVFPARGACMDKVFFLRPPSAVVLTQQLPAVGIVMAVAQRFSQLLPSGGLLWWFPSLWWTVSRWRFEVSNSRAQRAQIRPWMASERSR